MRGHEGTALLRDGGDDFADPPVEGLKFGVAGGGVRPILGRVRGIEGCEALGDEVSVGNGVLHVVPHVRVDLTVDVGEGRGLEETVAAVLQGLLGLNTAQAQG